MHIHRVLSLLALTLTCTSTYAQRAANFYVAPHGKDTWNGTLPAPNAAGTEGPLATPERALEIARKLRKADSKPAPINIILRGGRYELAEPLTFTPADSGTESAPLVFTAHPNEIPILSGGTLITPKVVNADWLIPVPDAKFPIRHISVSGEMRLPGRWPKEGQFTITGLAGADPKANYRTAADKFEFAEGQIDPTWKDTSEIEVVVLHFWVAGHYRIKSVDHKTRIVALDRPSIRRFTEDGGPKPGRFYLRNVPGELAPGEFHHDRSAGVIRYRPRAGEATGTTPVVIPRLDCIVRFEGKPESGSFIEHVEVRGLTFSDSTFDVGPKIAGDLQAAQNVPGSVRMRGAKHCTITDCRLVNLGGYGIDVTEGSRQNHLTRNELASLAAGGIRMNGGGAGSPAALRTGENLIADNHVHHLGLVFHAGVGILSQHADQNRLEHNHIHHVDYTGISVGWVWGYGKSVSENNIVEGNLIHDIGQKRLSDMGGIYMLGISPGTTIRGNVIHDVDSFGYGGWGIYTDEGSTGITIENNLVYRTKSGGFHQHYGKENLIRNNIFALAREGQLMRSRAEPHISFTFERNIVYANKAPLLAKNWADDKFNIDYNLYWDRGNNAPAFPGGKFAEWQARGHDTHSLIADPLFVDPEKGDFHMKPNSPAEKIGFKPFNYSTAGVRPRK